MEPRKLSEKDKEELQKEFPKIKRVLRNKKVISTLITVAVMTFWIAMLGLVLYYLYLTLTYQV